MTHLLTQKRGCMSNSKEREVNRRQVKVIQAGQTIWQGDKKCEGRHGNEGKEFETEIKLDSNSQFDKVVLCLTKWSTVLVPTFIKCFAPFNFTIVHDKLLKHTGTVNYINLKKTLYKSLNE